MRLEKAFPIDQTQSPRNKVSIISALKITPTALFPHSSQEVEESHAVFWLMFVNFRSNLEGTGLNY